MRIALPALIACAALTGCGGDEETTTDPAPASDNLVSYERAGGIAFTAQAVEIDDLGSGTLTVEAAGETQRRDFELRDQDLVNLRLYVSTAVDAGLSSAPPTECADCYSYELTLAAEEPITFDQTQVPDEAEDVISALNKIVEFYGPAGAGTDDRKGASQAAGRIGGTRPGKSGTARRASSPAGSGLDPGAQVVEGHHQAQAGAHLEVAGVQLLAAQRAGGDVVVDPSEEPWEGGEVGANALVVGAVEVRRGRDDRAPRSSPRARSGCRAGLPERSSPAAPGRGAAPTRGSGARPAAGPRRRTAPPPRPPRARPGRRGTAAGRTGCDPAPVRSPCSPGSCGRRS